MEEAGAAGCARRCECACERLSRARESSTERVARRESQLSSRRRGGRGRGGTLPLLLAACAVQSEGALTVACRVQSQH